MIFPETFQSEKLHELARNVDYTLRIHKAKSVIVISDLQGEGKTTFLAACTPLLSTLYKRKILIFDMTSGESEDLKQIEDVEGLAYLSVGDLNFFRTLSESERAIQLNNYFNELKNRYDVIFINVNTMRRAENTSIPKSNIDGAIVIRSKKSVGGERKYVTEELMDRNIPILGIVYNEGLA